MALNLLKLSDLFRDKAQINRVQDIIQRRLADDRNQKECRYLMRFWWQFLVSYQEVTLEELESYVSNEKFQIVLELLNSVEEGFESVDAWVERYEKLPVIEDRGFEIN